MAQAIMIQNLRGYFGVRKYKENKPKEQWKMLGNDDNITFGTSFDSLPVQFKELAREYTNKKGEKRFFVTFKIGTNCKWFDRYGKPTPRPDNLFLDGRQFEASIQYIQLFGDPNKLEPCGYWANAIMFKEIGANPFEGIAFDNETTETTESAMTEEEQATFAPQAVPTTEQVDQTDYLGVSYEPQVAEAPIYQPQPTYAAPAAPTIVGDMDLPF